MNYKLRKSVFRSLIFLQNLLPLKRWFISNIICIIFIIIKLYFQIQFRHWQKRLGKLFMGVTYILCTAAHPTDVGSLQMWHNLKSLSNSKIYGQGKKRNKLPNTCVNMWHRTCLWQPSTMISFCCGEVLAKTISVWLLKISSICSWERSFRSVPWITQALASLRNTDKYWVFLTVRPKAV